MTTERAGTVQEFRDARGRKYYRARITLPDGERVWLKPRFDRRERAEEYADEQARQAKKRKLTVAKAAPAKPKAAGETSDAWHGRYLAYCRERGIGTVGDKMYRWAKWISPKLGTRPMAEVTREEIEAVRDELDVAIRDGRLAPKTAQNVWGELTVSFAEACSSKRRDLKARADNPCSGVQPPENGVGRAKTYPYPLEFLRLAACEEVPIEWREIHAIAAYTYFRPGELWVLEWPDVDLEDQQIHVTKAWDFKAKRVKSTKTHETRAAPIHPNLLPLLRTMSERAGGKGLVVPTLAATNPDQLAKLTREHFERARVTRPRLYKNTKAERHLVFRSWRDAGITWAIVEEGANVVKVQRRAGHKLISTTMRYVVDAENRGAAFGTPFPRLPDCLVDPSKSTSKPAAVNLHPGVIAQEVLCERRELNTLQALETPIETADIQQVNGDEPAESVDDNPANPRPVDAGLDWLAAIDELEG